MIALLESGGVLRHGLDWLGTYALHSTCALGAALLFGLALRDRALVLQERTLRFAMGAALVSSLVQFFVLGGPWRGGAELAVAAVDVPEFRLALAALPPSDPVAGPTAAPLPWTQWLGGGAFAAAGLGLAWWWWSRLRLARVLAHRRAEQDARVLAVAGDVARELGLRRMPRLSRTERLATPIAFGWLRPEASLPARVDELDDASLRALLAHEFAHLRRRDPAVLAAASLLQALFPWQLLLPLVRRRWLRLVELRCDAIAAERSSPTAVARCLLEVAGWLQSQRAAPWLALAMAARSSSLRDRIEAALRPSTAAVPRRLWSAAFGGVSLSALAVVGPGFEPRELAGEPAVVVADAPAADAPLSLASVLGEHAQLAAEVAQLQAELAGRPVSPELEQLLVLLKHRLLVVERLATRIEQRLADRFPAGR